MNLFTSLKNTGSAALTTNGEHIWNYLHEEDAARALRLLGTNEGLAGVYNLASRECKPLKFFVEEVKRIIAPNAFLTYGIEKSEVNLNVSTEKIRKAIGEFENIGFSDDIKR